ncbi:glycoside hydrolase family 127 protein [candidate division KSB1 bacterium]|nr:glycoside hydrolase family 127 protein [candidate division KSB1 bacterium]
MKKILFLFACVNFLFLNSIPAQERLYRDTFAASDVSLLDGPFKHARDLNISVLLKYNVDRLLAPYRKEAGLAPKDSSYKNWVGLDGHIGGHYLSAMAMNFAATGNDACKKRLDYMLEELKNCQDANSTNNSLWGIGYVGGVPNSAQVWSTFKNGDLRAFHNSWVPWYNVHKMYAGLRDAWLYTGSEDAKSMFLKFCDWGIAITSGFSKEQMEAMLGTEHGGMNEVYADAYQMTGDTKYVQAAQCFSHKWLLNAMAAGVDNLDNKHANTQVPKAVGFQRIAELTGDSDYKNASAFFWEIVTGKRSLAFGGNSRREHFPSVAASADYIYDVEGPESCNTNNMLKLTADLFRVSQSVQYMDFFERALFNHILSTQHPQHGGYVYFTPARPQHYRVYSSPNQGMWCCVGTGMENHGKYNELIYTHNQDSLYVNLFIASTLHWREKGISLMQETRFPYEEKTKLTITDGASAFKLMLRYPFWVHEGELKIQVNGEPLSISAQPSSYFSIDRKWQQGDVIEIALPMQSRIEYLPNVPDYVAFLHGPILLGAKTGTEDLAGLIADDSRWGHIASGQQLPIDQSPILIEDDLEMMLQKLVPVDGKPLHYSLSNVKGINKQNLILQPFFEIHDTRYMIYWLALTNSQYKTYLDSIATQEKEAVALQNRTLDFVATGEQQPEVDHALQTAQSGSGVYQDQFWRDARDGGFFSYKLATNGETDLSLRVRYWGYEWGNREFDILLDDQVLVSENNTGRWYTTTFQELEYAIPNSLVENKNDIRLTFQSKKGSTAGAVYFLRLLKSVNQGNEE